MQEKIRLYSVEMTEMDLFYEANIGRSLGKNSAITAGVTAGLGASAYVLHKYLNKE